MTYRVLLSIAALFCLQAPARAETEVDVMLVLAVDVSRSMDQDEQQLQRAGYVEAFRSPVVHDAIDKGALGRVAVVYVEWSGPSDQKVVVPWTVLGDASSATAFADTLSRAPVGLVFATSISGAIDFSVRLTEESGIVALRRVIDISGDGPNNTGRTVTAARDEAVAKGFVLNGLPFMLKRPTGRGDIEDLDLYYRDCVIGGPGSFIVPIRDRSQIADAIRTKIIREIAGLLDLPLHRAQAPVPTNCRVGEQRSFQPGGQ